MSKVDPQGKSSTWKRLLLGILVVGCCLPANSWALNDKEALRGLKGLKVVVETLKPDVERLGLQKSQIQKDVETRLRRVGIKVTKDYKPPAMTALYVVVHTLNTSGRSVVIYSINVMLLENAYLKREIGSVGDLKEVRSAHWYRASVGYVPLEQVQDIRKKVIEQVEFFISDYLTVNRG